MSNYSLRNEYFYLNLQHKVFQNGKLRKKENEKSYPKLTTYTQPQYKLSHNLQTIINA